MRQVASVQKVTRLSPIEGKDLIELADVLGWHVVVQKGEVSIGDLCVYVESDALLPEKEEFEFLRKRCYSKRFGGFRIRVMKLGQVYSEGIVFPMSILGDAASKFKEGDDVSEVIGARSYDPDELRSINAPTQKHRFPWLRRFLVRIGLIRPKKKSQGWPQFAIKSDETRLGAMPKILEHLPGKKLYVTEKLDGQSALFFLHRGKFGVCSRNVWLIQNRHGGYDQGQYFEMAIKYGIERKMKELLRGNYAIQGEIVGPGIQGNKLRLPERRLFVYQIQDLDAHRFLHVDETVTICNQLGLDLVPVIKLDQYYDEFLPENTVDAWTQFSVRKSMITPEVWAEGIVVRPMRESYAPNLPTVLSRVSFKVINPEFILAYD